MGLRSRPEVAEERRIPEMEKVDAVLGKASRLYHEVKSRPFWRKQPDWREVHARAHQIIDEVYDLLAKTRIVTNFTFLPVWHDAHQDLQMTIRQMNELIALSLNKDKSLSNRPTFR